MRLTAASVRSSSGPSAASTTAASPSAFASSFLAISASPSDPAQGAEDYASGRRPALGRGPSEPERARPAVERRFGRSIRRSSKSIVAPNPALTPPAARPCRIPPRPRSLYSGVDPRPERSPNPSIAASAFAKSAKFVLMSSSLARFCSVGSAASACSASFSSLFSAPELRCKAMVCRRTCSASEVSASARRHHQLAIPAARLKMRSRSPARPADSSASAIALAAP